MASTRAAALEGDRLVVHCRQSFVRDQITRNLRTILGEWQRQFGQNLSVQCVVPEGWEPAGDEAPDPARDPSIRKAVERGWRVWPSGPG